MSEPPRPRGALSRADLVTVLAGGGPADAVARHIADLLNLERIPRAKPKKKPRAPDPSPQTLPTQPEAPRVLNTPRLDTPFWRLEAREYAPDTATTTRPAPAPYTGWRNPPQEPPRFQPLATWVELAPRLRQVLSDYREGRAIDLDLTVQRISRGRILEHFPCERRRRWGPTLTLIEDDSRRLIPYRNDKRLIRAALRRLLPDHALCRALIDDGLAQPYPLGGAASDWPPPPGTLVLALGDLGSLAVQGARLRERWLEIGRDLVDAGCHPLVLFPAPAARLLLPPEQADAGTEADVWQHRALTSDSGAGATIAPDEARTLRRAFAREEPLALRRRLIRLIKTWRGDLPEEIWFDELLNADPAALQADPDAPEDPDWSGDLSADLDDARSYIAAFCDENPLPSAPSMPANDRAWVARLKARSTEHLWTDPLIGARLAELAIELTRNDPTPDLPPGIAPGRPEGRGRIVQTGNALRAIQAMSEGESAGSLLADITIHNGLIEIKPLDEGAVHNTFWEAGEPPPWAGCLGLGRVRRLGRLLRRG